MHWGGIPTAVYSGEEVKNLYATVDSAYSSGWYRRHVCFQHGYSRISLVAWIRELISNAWFESLEI